MAITLKLLKELAEHSMERYEIPWEEETLQDLIEQAKDCAMEIAEYEQAYQDTQDALYEVEEDLLNMYKIRVLYERYLAIKHVTQENTDG